MPYADNGGIRIHYEVEGTGPALLLQHGITQCVEDWFECGYVVALRPRYRLILVDARGHGQSDKPHDAASYALDSRVADVVAVMDAVGVKRAHFWGYSMGGYIGFGMAKHAPQRINALVIGGQHPFARNQEGLREMMREGISGGGDAFIVAFEKMDGPISDAYAARLRTADFEAYLRWYRTELVWRTCWARWRCHVVSMLVTPIRFFRRRDWRASGFRIRDFFRYPVLLICRLSMKVGRWCRWS